MSTGNNDAETYYTIGEVAEMTEVKTSVLRFWESEFTQLHPRKNKFGHRVYTNNDIQIISQIKSLLYQKGLTIKGARQELESGNLKVQNSGVNNKIIKSKLNALLDMIHDQKKEPGKEKS